MIDELESKPGCKKNRIDIWCFDFYSRAKDFSADRSLLSVDEMEKANRFVRPVDRARFVTTRAILRRLLSQLVGVAPQSIVFSYNRSGKPALPEIGGTKVHFNVSHTTEYGSIGVARCGELGVDLESIDRIDDPHKFAELCLSDSETKSFRRFDSSNSQQLDDQRRFLMRHWTLKEAYLKGRGTGMNIRPTELEIRPQNSNRGFLIYHRSELQREWWLRSIELPNKLQLAVALEKGTSGIEPDLEIHWL